MHKFNMSFVFHFCILGLKSWIWTNSSTERLKYESPSKWNSYEGFNLEHCIDATKAQALLPLKLGPSPTPRALVFCFAFFWNRALDPKKKEKKKRKKYSLPFHLAKTSSKLLGPSRESHFDTTSLIFPSYIMTPISDDVKKVSQRAAFCPFAEKGPWAWESRQVNMKSNSETTLDFCSYYVIISGGKSGHVNRSIHMWRYICGCYSVRFSCSPTATDLIYTINLVFL